MWVINKSFIDNENGLMDGTTYKPVEICGPTGWGPETRPIYMFRMRDDDNNLYYEGYCTAESFAPLDDFGMPNDGCTTIEYFDQRTREWNIL